MSAIGGPPIELAVPVKPEMAPAASSPNPNPTAPGGRRRPRRWSRRSAARSGSRGWGEGADPSQRLAEDQRVHLVGALVGEHRFEVVHVPDHRVLPSRLVAAEDAPRGPRDLDGLAHVAHLAEANLLGPQRALVLLAAPVP